MFWSYPTIPVDSLSKKSYDFIIIGAGTAGSVIASRLSERNPSLSVLVIEKGGVRDNFLSRIPLLSQNPGFPTLQTVLRHSEPIPEANGQKTRLWSAEAVGGTTRMNGGMWTRGVPAGYNEWATEYGLAEWSWEKVEPVFRGMENALSHPTNERRGHGGKVPLRQPGTVYGIHEWADKAAERVGLKVVEDVNDPLAPSSGCFKMEHTVDERGMRASAYRVWLPKEVVSARKNLDICTGAVVKRLVFDEDGKRVTALRVMSVTKGGKREEVEVKVKKEVVVCAGALCTPQLLMLSGIGPRAQLDSLGIPLVKELDHVGRNFADHTSFPIMSEVPQDHTLHILQRPLVFLGNLLLYIVWGVGLLAANTTCRSIFVSSRDIDEHTLSVPSETKNQSPQHPDNIPDVEIMINPVNCLPLNIPNKHLTTWYVTLAQPFSQGRLELRSKNPLDHVKFHYPLFTDRRDLVVLRKAVRFAMKMAHELAHNVGYPEKAKLAFAPGMDLGYLSMLIASIDNEKVKVLPSPGFDLPDEKYKVVTDAEIDEYVSYVATCGLHPSCTARMARNESEGVVDQRLRVFGVENLRVADASVQPKISSGHLMAPILMIGERAAEFIQRDLGSQGR
ncbi:hypothetical protein QBC43DRAFT_56334 [Cladorrhinum sp. PSN259]|nr:hypothetical protein QBC43DRAFT_56334 [Cladorrhinum sp. PSN259]